MKIAVLSDTHVQRVEELHPEIVKALSSVDLIVHAGDFVGVGVLEGLRRMGELKAVRGNMDSLAVKEILPEKEVFVVGSKKVGLVHGWGAPLGIEERVRGLFDAVDIIIFGHSHWSKCEKIGDIFFFNPGPGFRSFGVLTIEDDVRGEIIKIG
jgi:putative phosphoesterase